MSVGIQSQSDGSAGTMKLSVALFFAGLFGALAAVFILLSFGTDYWLLASESCPLNSSGSVQLGGVAVEVGVQAAGRGGSERSRFVKCELDFQVVQGLTCYCFENVPLARLER